MALSVWCNGHGPPPPILRTSGTPKFAPPFALIRQPARTFLPIFLMKTKLVLAEKSKTEMIEATDSAFDKKDLPTLEPEAMCYMMSKQLYINDGARNWHPHVMFLVARDAGKGWGANLPARRL